MSTVPLGNLADVRPVRLLALVGALALLGVPLGLAWLALAPTADVTVQGGEATGIVVGEALIGSDATLLALVAGAAFLAGIATGLRGTRDGPVLPVALALATGLMAVVAWQVGEVVGSDRGRAVLAAAPDGAQVAVNVALRAHGVIVAAPLVALVVHLLVALQREREPRTTRET